VKLARELGADKVVSVDVTSYYKKENQLKTPLDVLISGMNLSVARTMFDIKDKGDVYLHIEQPRTAFTKLTRENAMISINYGKKVAKAMLPEIKNLMKD
jgi:hypothetical protein